ncbi:peptidase M23 [Ancylomarina euxinus]|uniref:Peptidase M23 n=1 Tax=Ancylomarina euxinus TaxID=2283627 RepID=A0A425Y7S9_9BACT|nr:peptidoglycan DD-metalloendopeptidase family protein [Ancylomarina euxinus]MCZ4693633.1 peptidoglycan DD-metalloendopeptidase family protein [Ancylomarina euxinus]MUP13861.1 peptidoglycan DD-metalloendopeptidase family protein [Ancylomarina euxinus]RRG24508.1 peptidase M23 [Ancylomarina euxinus]
MGFLKRQKSILFFIIFFLLLNGSVKAQDISKLQKQKEQNAKDIAYTQKLLQSTQQQQKSSLGLLSVLNRKIKLQEDLILNIQKELDFTDSKIGKTNKEISSLEKKYDDLKLQYEKLIVYAHRQKNSRDKLMFLFASKDFNQAYMRYKYLQQFSEFTRKRGEQLVETKVDLDIKLDRLKLAKIEKQVLLTQNTEASKNLSSQKRQQSDVLSQLKKKEKTLRKNLATQQKNDKKLEKMIRDIIAEQARLAKKKKNIGGEYGLTPEEKALGANFGQNKGNLPWPTATGFISQKFGQHAHPVLKHVRVNNDGVDITTKPQSICRSIFKGEVTHILSMPGLNMVVIIKHGDYMTVYSNLAKVTVKKGDYVAAKESIGVIYTDENENQTVLKFQMWKETNKLNPSVWLLKK